METEDGFEWIGGSSIGGGTFWGLGALLTKTQVLGPGRALAAGSPPRGGLAPAGRRLGSAGAVHPVGQHTAQPRVPGPACLPRSVGLASGPQGSFPLPHLTAPPAPSLQKFDELLHLASRGQHANVDMLVQDIYGGAHQTLGLSGNLIASSFGKSATTDQGTGGSRSRPPARRCHRPPPAAGFCLPEFSPEDMAKSLLHMISNDIGQLACLYARLHGLDRVYFGGFFIRGHPVTMRTITYSISFFSKARPALPPPVRTLRPWNEPPSGGHPCPPAWPAPSPGDTCGV